MTHLLGEMSPNPSNYKAENGNLYYRACSNARGPRESKTGIEYWWLVVHYLKVNHF